MNDHIRPQPGILDIALYEGGKASVAGVTNIVKLSSNENPFGPSDKAKDAFQRSVHQLHRYPSTDHAALRDAIGETHGLDPARVICGVGSDEIITFLCQAYAGPKDEVVFTEHGFLMYRISALAVGATPVEVPMPGYRHDLKAMRDAVTPKTRIVFLASPNNPTGGTDEPADILAFAASLPEDVIFCLDEAYTEYLEASADLRPLMKSGRKVVLSRTFSKAYGLAGLRVGYLMGSTEVCGLLNRIRQPFNVNLPALAAAEAALDDVAFVRRTREVNDAGIAQLSAGLNKLGFAFIDGKANFLAAQIPKAEEAFTILQRAGVIVRPLRGYGMTGWLRLTVGTEAQNARLLSELAKL